MRRLLAKSASSYEQHALMALLFLTVLALPLHFHSPTVAQQLTKECSCFHGNKTQTGPAPAPVMDCPVLDVQPVQISRQDWTDSLWQSDAHIRAPPTITST